MRKSIKMTVLGVAATATVGLPMVVLAGPASAAVTACSVARAGSGGNGVAISCTFVQPGHLARGVASCFLTPAVTTAWVSSLQSSQSTAVCPLGSTGVSIQVS